MHRRSKGDLAGVLVLLGIIDASVIKRPQWPPGSLAIYEAHEMARHGQHRRPGANVRACLPLSPEPELEWGHQHHRGVVVVAEDECAMTDGVELADQEVDQRERFDLEDILDELTAVSTFHAGDVGDLFRWFCQWGG